MASQGNDIPAPGHTDTPGILDIPYAETPAPGHTDMAKCHTDVLGHTEIPVLGYEGFIMSYVRSQIQILRYWKGSQKRFNLSQAAHKNVRLLAAYFPSPNMSPYGITCFDPFITANMIAPELSLPPVPLDKLAGYIAKHPDKPLADILQPYRKFEAELRQVYAQQPDHELLRDPKINVLPLFTDSISAIKIRARDVEAEPQEEKDRYIMTLSHDKRHPHGSPAVVQSLDEFRDNFAIFSELSLVGMNWDGVVAAGSSVVNCILPVPNDYKGSKRLLREYYHEKFCPTSDVDLFLYGLSEKEAVEKIKEIESCIKNAILPDITTVRTKHAITICSQYPTRHVQIILRIYSSISEILTGFDIDCSGAAYDGRQVYCTPRALQSYISQINHIDLSRRSPSYENRLSKYSRRNFEVYWPDLDRSLLERLSSSSRIAYSAKRRGCVNQEEVSNYHTFTIPYGPRFNAKRIENFCYTRDLLLNAEWSQPEDRDVYLHRHPAFFGRVEDIIRDRCGFCPTPESELEKDIAKEESKTYVSGDVVFIKDNPGRQQIGSFHPLTENDWTEMAYLGSTACLCQGIVNDNVVHVDDLPSHESADIRLTTLQIAVNPVSAPVHKSPAEFLPEAREEAQASVAKEQSEVEHHHNDSDLD